MNANDMQISRPDAKNIADEEDVLDELLHLDGATVLELGCGSAAKTRVVAQKAASVLALEVDEIQLAKNNALTDLENVTFRYGGAEQIPADDASVDIVLMFKSLHHVPVEHMDQTFSEIRRVLKPGGMAYISEPIFDGDFNQIVRLFNDEEVVRAAAFDATRRAVASGLMTLKSQKFFLQPIHFDHFEQFADSAIHVTHSSRQLSEQKLEQVRTNFNRHMTEEGANFLMPMRVDLLVKP